MSSKVDSRVDVVELLQENLHYVYLRFSDGKETTVSLKLLCHAKRPLNNELEYDSSQPSFDCTCICVYVLICTELSIPIRKTKRPNSCSGSRRTVRPLTRLDLWIFYLKVGWRWMLWNYFRINLKRYVTSLLLFEFRQRFVDGRKVSRHTYL